jgi:carbonic anhydrase
MLLTTISYIINFLTNPRRSLNSIRSDASSTIQWSYDKEYGVEEWDKYFKSAKGSHQSPINLSESVALTCPRLENNSIIINYEDDFCCRLENNGRTIMFTGDFNSLSTVIGGPILFPHKFLQFHMHWGPFNSIGSEHLVDHSSYSAEIHFVNWNPSKFSNPDDAATSSEHEGLVVLGIFVEIGKENEEFNYIISLLDKVSLSGSSTDLPRPINYKLLFPKDTSQYWTYKGSLTTPPCDESVSWIVFKHPIQVSSEQLDKFRNKLHSCSNEQDCCDSTKIKANFRPVCQLNDRCIKKSF